MSHPISFEHIGLPNANKVGIHIVICLQVNSMVIVCQCGLSCIRTSALVSHASGSTPLFWGGNQGEGDCNYFFTTLRPCKHPTLATEREYVSTRLLQSAPRTFPCLREAECALNPGKQLVNSVGLTPVNQPVTACAALVGYETGLTRTHGNTFQPALQERISTQSLFRSATIKSVCAGLLDHPG